VLNPNNPDKPTASQLRILSDSKDLLSHGSIAFISMEPPIGRPVQGWVLCNPLPLLNDLGYSVFNQVGKLGKVQGKAWMGKREGRGDQLVVTVHHAIVRHVQ
jgi:hypothetical protein